MIVHKRARHTTKNVWIIKDLKQRTISPCFPGLRSPVPHSSQPTKTSPVQLGPWHLSGPSRNRSCLLHLERFLWRIPKVVPATDISFYFVSQCYFPRENSLSMLQLLQFSLFWLNTLSLFQHVCVVIINLKVGSLQNSGIL